jgi:methionine-rich copper-binding protein CopC
MPRYHLLRLRQGEIMFPWRAAILSLTVLIATLTGAPDGAAHALVMSSIPAANTTVAAGTVRIALTFNSRIDKKRSRVVVHASDAQDLIVPIASDGSENVLRGDVVLARAGAYQIRWQVLSRDGHITRGIIPFAVGDDKATR